VNLKLVGQNRFTN